MVATDSRTVLNWMNSTIEGRNCVRSKGAAEMLVKRQLGVMRETISEHGLSVTIRYVSTVENRV